MTFSFRAPRLDLDKIAASGQCFRWTPGPVGGYIVPSGGRCAAIYRFEDWVCIHEYTLPVSAPVDTEAVTRDAWLHYLGETELYAEYWDVLDLWTGREPNTYLTRAIRAADGMRILNQEPFETLVSFIISQNNNITRIKRTIEAICRKIGRRHYIPTARGNFPGAEWWDFPAAEALTDERALQGFGLGYRAPYVAAAARAVVEGRLDFRELRVMPYPEARAVLKTIPGVGDKVADCVCLYGLGHIEAFPIDVHIRRVLEREFPEGFPFRQCMEFPGFVQQLVFYYERGRKEPPHKPEP